LNKEIGNIIKGFDKAGYVLNEELATVIFLGKNLEKPILLEGYPGVGKTTVAKSLSIYLQTKLIRLQCYEGLDVNSSIYEWNYQKQLLNIKIFENKKDSSKVAHEIFGMDYLLQRPLLQSITNQEGPPVLLIDEIDRADEEFEAFLLEMLSDFQISIPEIGTIEAKYKPYVILTSNRTRELSDALKRRCLFHWLDYPEKEKEVEIIKKNIPEIEDKLANQIASVIHKLRTMKLNKYPGIAESIDWARTLLALNYTDLDREAIENSLGVILKSLEDIKHVKQKELEEILQEV